MDRKDFSSESQKQNDKRQLFELEILYGVDGIDPETEDFIPEQMAELIDSIVGIQVCRNYKLLPIKLIEKDKPALLIAMVNPDDLQALDTVTKLLRSKGLAIKKIVITKEDYDKLLRLYYDQQEKRERQIKAQQEKLRLHKEKLADVSGIMEDLEYVNFGEVEDDIGVDLATIDDANQAPVISLGNKILIKALQDGVSDIHIEPQEKKLRVRYRKDGVLQEVLVLPKKITPALVERFKIMADLNITEKKSAQAGKIRRRFQGRNVDFLVHSLPTLYGEKICLAIVDNSITQLGLDFLIKDRETLQEVRQISSSPFGLILVTGPTASGKSTTLYSILAERNNPKINISLVEDIIEHSLPDITQISVIPKKGMDYSPMLRSLLKQAPDIIVVGETGNQETAKTIMEATFAGRLVLTTLNSYDTAKAIARLYSMGLERFIISEILLGILSQRLMGKLCKKCRIPYHPSPQELLRFGLSADSHNSVTFYKAKTLSPEEMQIAQREDKVCRSCYGRGYKGRIAAYELMLITKRLRKLIIKGANSDMLTEVAVEEGMKTMLAYSLNLVRQGYTSLAEVERVLPDYISSVKSPSQSLAKEYVSPSFQPKQLRDPWLDD